MRLIVAAVFLVVLILLGAKIYSFLGEKTEAERAFNDIKSSLDKAQGDSDKFQAELDYYLNPANLEKELRARFNYRRPDEKMLIIVPRETSSTPQ
ncbi:MAG: hypothetical protein AAB655_01135 [Patescibacteria group bacterium]